ncbi:uncharacterized protein LOC134039306 isoform X2 [Osmerus eperlanus]|uniref:uncharacterized protein LOC134039306 isoform X2 n=1 Tax=Osmerus eperlanus TaxID=29151 RepID=UPI002E0EA2E7
MPGPGSTSRKCVACHTVLNVACKTCKACKVEQPHKLRLNKKMIKFDQKREGWVHTQKKNRTTSHIKDEAYMLLEKLQSLEVRAVLLLSRPAKMPNAWVSEVLTPRCQLTETSRSCQQRIQDLFDILIQGWTPQGTAEVQLEASVGPPAASVGLSKALTGPPAASVGLPKASVGPPAASVELPKASVGPPAASVGLPKALTGPPAASAGLPKASVGPPETMTGPPADESVEGVCPAPTTVLPRTRKECPHTVTGSQDFYPVKRVTKFKVIKGQTMKQVEWEPCKLCGKKWPLEWVADTDTIGIH